MKTILLICAIAAIATALPSDDVETDLLTPANEVVPETELVEATAGAGRWVKCTMGHSDPDCGKKQPYTTAQKGWKWVGMFNLHAKPPKHRRAPLCKDMTQEDPRKVCRCKGSHQDHAGHGAEPCFARPSWTASYKKMAACGPGGYAFSDTCSKPKGYVEPLPPPPKKCKCTVTGGNYGGRGILKKSVHTELGGTWKKDWMSHNQGFKKIKCTGCSYVVLEDDDHKRWQDNHVMHCCGKKECKLTLPYDLEDDIKQVHLGKAC